jgi:hypothetical protein
VPRTCRLRFPLLASFFTLFPLFFFPAAATRTSWARWTPMGRIWAGSPYLACWSDVSGFRFLYSV